MVFYYRLEKQLRMDYGTKNLVLLDEFCISSMILLLATGLYPSNMLPFWAADQNCRGGWIRNALDKTFQGSFYAVY